MKKFTIYLALFGAAILQACNGDSRPNINSEQPTQEEGTSVEVISAEEQDISHQVRSYGNIRAQEIVSVTPQISNRVTGIHADLGDTVKQGDVLAKIYDVPYRDQVRQAESQLRQNQATFSRDSLQFYRQQALYEKDLISSSEYDEAQATFQNSKAQLESAEANLTESRENLNNTEIKSPVNGVVLERNISEGDVSSTGTDAFEVANLIGYQVRIYLPREEWQQVRIGQSATFNISNQPEVQAKGRVTRLSPGLNPTTGLGEIVISLTERDQRIQQGALVQAVVDIETSPNAVIIPRSTLVETIQTLIEPETNNIEIHRSYSAFVVHGDSLAIQKELELGIEQGHRVEVVNGINTGDKIVITGQNNLQDSTKVHVAGQQDIFEDDGISIENSSQEAVSSDQRDTSSTY